MSSMTRLVIVWDATSTRARGGLVVAIQLVNVARGDVPDAVQPAADAVDARFGPGTASVPRT